MTITETPPQAALPAPKEVAPPSLQPSTSGLALASMVLGIVWLGGLGSLLAVIFAAIAKTQIRGSQGRQGGDGMATAGLALGIVGLACGVLFSLLLLVGAISATN